MFIAGFVLMGVSERKIMAGGERKFSRSSFNSSKCACRDEMFRCKRSNE